MRRNAVKIIGAIGGLFAVAAVILPIWLGYKTYRQNALDPELIAAIDHKDAVGVRRLLTEGASANATDVPVPHQSLWQCIVAEVKRAFKHRRTSIRHGHSALVLAVWWNSTEIVQLLLSHGATGVNDEVMAEYQYASVKRPLLELGAILGNAAIVSQLIEHGADVNKQDGDGNPPIQMANQPEILEILLDHGANPNASWIPVHDSFPEPLLIRIARTWLDNGNRTLRAMQLLMQHGADANATDRGGFTVLMEVSEHEPPSVLRCLIQYGARVNTMSSNGTALCCATIIGDDRDGNIRVLLAAGADPNLSMPYSGDTPLIMASSGRHADEVRDLLAAGAHINQPGSEGYTALDNALNQKDSVVIQLLKRHGAKASGQRLPY